MSRSLILVAATLTVLAWPAQAQTSPDQISPDLATAITRCLDVSDRNERLGCFEQAARAIRTAGNAAVVPDADRQRADFGLSRERVAATRTPRAPKPAKPAPVRELSAAITSVSSLGSGFRLGLDNGSEWDVTSSSLGRAPEAGDQILVETGVLSGYRAFIKGKPGLLRVRRVR